MSATITNILLSAINELNSRIVPSMNNSPSQSSLEMNVKFVSETLEYNYEYNYETDMIGGESKVDLFNKYDSIFKIDCPGNAAIIKIDNYNCVSANNLGHVIQTKNNKTFHGDEQKNWLEQSNDVISSLSHDLSDLSLFEIFDNTSKELLSYIEELSQFNSPSNYTEIFVRRSFKYEIIFFEKCKLSIELLDTDIQIEILYNSKWYPIQAEFLFSTLTELSNGTFNENTPSLSDSKPNLEKIAAYNAQCILRDEAIAIQRSIDLERSALWREQAIIRRNEERRLAQHFNQQNQNHILEPNPTPIDWTALSQNN